MSITGALSNANTGLAAASKRADIVANNVANALTPGYSRREVSVAEQVLNGGGVGVTVTGVTRAADPVLTREKRDAEAVMARDQAIASAYQALNSAMGEDGDPYSLFGQYQSFETALRNLAETPESVANQSSTLDAAKSLAATLNQLATQAQTARQNAEAEIARGVQTVNAALEQVQALNTEITKATTDGVDTTALEDQRKQLIDKISSFVPVREVPSGQGKVDLITNDGVYLLSGSVKPLAFTQKGVLTAGLTYAGGSLSGLTAGGIDITPGGASSTSVKQGSLAGQFAIRDDIMPKFQGQIDSLARDLIERFEGVDPTLAPGAPGLFTDAGAALDPTKEAGLAARIAVNTAVDPAQGGALWRLRDGLGAGAQGPTGDASLLTALLDSFTAARSLSSGSGLSAAYSASEAAANVSSLVGASRVTADATLASSSARSTSASDAETAASAVDSDEELQKLILIEQAYSANAKVIKTAQTMLEILMGL